MSKKLEESLNLASMDDAKQINDIATSLEKIDVENIPSVRTDEDIAVSEHIDEMNEVYASALKAHNEILDLGYSVDVKYTAGVLNSSATFLDIAVKASKSKIDNKLKQMKQKMERQDAELARRSISGEPIDVAIDQSSGPTEVLTRNEVMARLEAIMKNGKAPEEPTDEDTEE